MKLLALSTRVAIIDYMDDTAAAAATPIDKFVRLVHKCSYRGPHRLRQWYYSYFYCFSWCYHCLSYRQFPLFKKKKIINSYTYFQHDEVVSGLFSDLQNVFDIKRLFPLTGDKSEKMMSKISKKFKFRLWPHFLHQMYDQYWFIKSV